MLAGKLFYAALAAGIAFIAIGGASSIYSNTAVDVSLDYTVRPGTSDIITPDMNVGSTGSIMVSGSTFNITISDPDGQMITSESNATSFSYDLTAQKAGVHRIEIVNTGSTASAITFLDGEAGVLRYRGYPVEELAERSTFVETAYLLIFGELPTATQLADFRRLLGQHEFIHEDMLHHFDGFPANAPPMAILSAMINALGCFQPAFIQPEEDDHFMAQAARLMSKVRTIAAASYRKSIGRPVNYPRSELRYTTNLLHMMFSQPHKLYQPDEVVVRALDQLLLLHADHEQNCSTSTVRMVGSSQANLFTSISAGICALSGPLHGGANVAVMQMLQAIHDEGGRILRLVPDQVRPAARGRQRPVAMARRNVPAPAGRRLPAS